jgi:hypothetical protein
MLGWIRRNAARTLARHALPPEREPSLFTRRLIDATMAMAGTLRPTRPGAYFIRKPLVAPQACDRPRLRMASPKTYPCGAVHFAASAVERSVRNRTASKSRFVYLL